MFSAFGGARLQCQGTAGPETITIRSGGVRSRCGYRATGWARSGAATRSGPGTERKDRDTRLAMWRCGVS